MGETPRDEQIEMMAGELAASEIAAPVLEGVGVGWTWKQRDKLGLRLGGVDPDTILHECLQHVANLENFSPARRELIRRTAVVNGVAEAEVLAVMAVKLRDVMLIEVCGACGIKLMPASLPLRDGENWPIIRGNAQGRCKRCA